MSTTSEEWVLVNHDNDDQVVRGPFPTSDTAAAVRREMERHEPWSDEGNLWIVPRPAEHSPTT